MTSAWSTKVEVSIEGKIWVSPKLLHGYCGLEIKQWQVLYIYKSENPGGKFCQLQSQDKIIYALS